MGGWVTQSRQTTSKTLPKSVPAQNPVFSVDGGAELGKGDPSTLGHLLGFQSQVGDKDKDGLTVEQKPLEEGPWGDALTHLLFQSTNVWGAGVW